MVTENVKKRLYGARYRSFILIQYDTMTGISFIKYRTQSREVSFLFFANNLYTFQYIK
jgi:hypothetical protein